MTPQIPILNFIIHDEKWASFLPSWREEITSAMQAIISELEQDFSHSEVTLVFTDDGEIQELNKTFRKQNKPTNVLSFPSGDEEHLGDIVLAYETISAESAQDSLPFLNHVLHLIIHGFLHLLGHDHDTEEKAEEMEGLEIRALKTLNIANPYEER